MTTNQARNVLRMAHSSQQSLLVYKKIKNKANQLLRKQLLMTTKISTQVLNKQLIQIEMVYKSKNQRLQFKLRMNQLKIRSICQTTTAAQSRMTLKEKKIKRLTKRLMKVLLRRILKILNEK